MTVDAVRVDLPGDVVVYVLEDTGGDRELAYYQDAESYRTARATVSPAAARRLRRAGREVPLAATPAWCDPDAPATDSARARGA